MKKDPGKNQQAIKKAHENFINGRRVETGSVRPEILQSWQRSKALGIDPEMKKFPSVLNKGQVSELLAANELLISCARDILKNFFHLIREDTAANNVIMLMDREAYLLEVMGEGQRWRETPRTLNVKIGSCFQERLAGTTASALTLKYDRPFEISGEEYFLKILHVTRDFSVPIHDEKGQIIGMMQLAVDKETTLNYSHTLALVVAIAGMIEKQLQLMQAIEQKDFFSKSLVASMASLEEGLIVLGADNKIVHINPFIEKMLGVKLDNVRNQDIRKLLSNRLMLEAIDGNTDLVDHEVILDESVKGQRYLVSSNHVLSSTGKRLGLTFIFKEFKTVQTLVQRVAGLHAHYTFDDIWGESPAIKNVIRISKIVSKSTSNLLIVGESGTGKELVAQSIHNASIGSAGPFMAINCAAFPSEMIESEIFGYEPGTFTGGLRQGKSGKLELANGGTLFLDEVNGMSLDMQIKLLRVLEEKKFQRLGGHRYITLDARIIAATNQDLRERVALGNFRSDLYYRLGVVEIQILPLRHRKQDIEIYVNCFIKEMNRKLGRSIQGCSPEAMDCLMSYSWPGNVRELKNWIERAANLSESDILTPDDFPSPVNAEPRFSNDRPVMSADIETSLSGSIELIERDRIKLTLRRCGGNTEQASRDLGIGRATLYRKIKKYGIVSKEIH